MSGSQSRPAADERHLRDGFTPPAEGETFNPYKAFLGYLVPLGLARYRRISPGSKLTLACLTRHAGEKGRCYPSALTVARELGVGESQVRRYFRELKRHRFIKTELRPGHSSNFKFLWHRAFDGLDVGEFQKNNNKLVYPQTDTPLYPQTNTRPGHKRIGKESKEREPDLKRQSSSSFNFLSKRAQHQNSGGDLTRPAAPPPNGNKKLDDDKIGNPSNEKRQETGRVVWDDVLGYVQEPAAEPLSYATGDRLQRLMAAQGVTPAEFLTVIKKHNIRKVKSPAAFLTDLAQKWPSATTAHRVPVKLSEPNPKVCTLGLCKGTGHTKIAKEGIVYCACPRGVELQQKAELSDRRRSVAQIAMTLSATSTA